MEWGTFITVIAAIYLAWFGLNFLYDLFIGGKPQVEAPGGIHYNMSDLMAEEEKPQVVNQKDYEEKTVEVHNTSAPDTSDELAADGSGQSMVIPPAPVQSTPVIPTETADWASAIDQDEQEGIIKIPVQGQPLSVMDYIKSLRDEAKSETSAITF